MVLDVVIGAAYQVLRYFRPPIPVLVVQLQDLVVLLVRPLVLLDVGV